MMEKNIEAAPEATAETSNSNAIVPQKDVAESMDRAIEALTRLAVAEIIDAVETYVQTEEFREDEGDREQEYEWMIEDMKDGLAITLEKGIRRGIENRWPGVLS